jgi:hypothetical protein
MMTTGRMKKTKTVMMKMTRKLDAHGPGGQLRLYQGKIPGSAQNLTQSAIFGAAISAPKNVQKCRGSWTRPLLYGARWSYTAPFAGPSALSTCRSCHSL